MILVTFTVQMGQSYVIDSQKINGNQHQRHFTKHVLKLDTHIVEMQMTLTAPGCGMGPAIAEDAQNHLETVPGVEEAKVSIVWDPPWDQEMITEEGKMILGLI